MVNMAGNKDTRTRAANFNQDEKKNGQEIKCYECGKSSHMSYDCPKKRGKGKEQKQRMKDTKKVFKAT